MTDTAGAGLPHVVLVTSNPVPTGGMQTFTRSLVRWMCAAGWRVTVACNGRDIYSDAGLGRDDLQVRPVGWVDDQLAGDRAYSVRTILNRRAWFRAVKPDLAVFVQSSNTPFRAAIAGARLAGVPVVMTHRTLPWPIETAPSRRHLLGLIPGLGLHGRLLKIKTRVTATLSTRVVCNSEAVADAYASVYGYPRRCLTVIPNAVEPVAASVERDEPGYRDPLRVGYVGRLGIEKGVDILLKAIAQVPADVQTELHIAGDGPERDALEGLAAHIGLKNVIWHGEVADPQQVYRKLDLLVMPSRRESSSNTVLEAMSMGIPVVVSDAGGLPELVDHGACGIIIDVEDVSALAATIHRVARDHELRQQLCHAARARVEAHHHPRHVADAWLALMAEAAGREYIPVASPSDDKPMKRSAVYQYEEVGA